MPTAPYLKRLQTAAIIRDRAQPTPDTPAEPATRRALRIVPDDEVVDRPALPARQEAPRVSRLFAATNGRTQHRFSAGKLLGQLGWNADTTLETSIDRTAGVLWVRPVDDDRGDRRHRSCGCSGSCDTHRDTRADFPGPVTAAHEAVKVNADRLVLTPGLANAIGLGYGEDVALVVVPDTGGVAICALPALIGGALKELCELPTHQAPHPH